MLKPSSDGKDRGFLLYGCPEKSEVAIDRRTVPRRRGPSEGSRGLAFAVRSFLESFRELDELSVCEDDVVVEIGRRAASEGLGCAVFPGRHDAVVLIVGGRAADEPGIPAVP